MKVVICGGMKTSNIVSGIKKKFDSGGVDFIVVPFIENIEDIYQRGEYFDKAIIVEQGWNHDYEDDDEVTIRTRVNNFANSSAERGLYNVSYVFLTQDEDVASQVYEEILPIQRSSVVILRQPRYSVTFFNSLVTTEIDKFPVEIIYVPEVIDEIKISDIEFEEQPKEIEYETKYGDDITAEIFGNNDVEYNGNRLEKPEEVEFEYNRDPEEIITEIESDWEIGGNFEGFDPDFQGTNPGFDDIDLNEISGDIGDGSGIDTGDEFGGFPDIEDIGEEPFTDIGDTDWDEIKTNEFKSEFEEIEFTKSGEIPDFTEPDEDMTYIKTEPEFTYEPEVTYESDFKPEFDDYTPEQPEQFEPFGQEEYDPDLDRYNTGGGQFPREFDDKDYEGENDVVAPSKTSYQRTDMSNDQIKITLDAFANRGNSIMLTGCGGCGTSTIALNLANIINKLGYTVLVVDLDTENKPHSYMSRENYECVEPDSAGLMAAINSTSGINAHVSIVRPGLHLLTMGMSSDSAPIEKIIHKEKISRFINLAKTSHNFVIYDIPFKTAMGFGKEFTFMADNIVINIDCSNWGITKAMLNICNVDDDDMQETLFNRGQLLFNRYRILNKVMGRKVKTAMDITKVMDFKVRELLGEDPGFYFQSMHICGLINEDPTFEAGWFENAQYSDTDMGSKLFLELVKNIVLKR